MKHMSTWIEFLKEVEAIGMVSRMFAGRVEDADDMAQAIPFLVSRVRELDAALESMLTVYGRCSCERAGTCFFCRAKAIRRRAPEDMR
jgi:hypothetical protein